MKIQGKLAFFLLIAVLSLVSSCKKEELDTTQTEIIEETELIGFNIYGSVLDENNNPIQDAMIVIDNHVTTSLENGIYYFNGIEAQGPRVKITITHPSYFKMYRTVDVVQDGDYKVNIKMTNLINAGTISSLSGGEIVSADNVKINFKANSFVKEDGSAYAGNVSVYINLLDPSSPTLDENFPAGFDILTEQNEKKILQAYSGIGVELFGDSGESLQLNMPATINLPVSNSLVADAPTALVLGHYDKQKGYWVEEGTATLEGNYYVAEVSHFSYWCALVMNDPTRILGYVFEDLNDTLLAVPIEDLFVKVSLANTSVAGYTRTGTDGYFDIRVPKNEDLVIEFFANSFNTTCGNPVYTEAIPSLSSYYDMGNIKIDAPDMITVTGTVLDCNQQEMADGYVLMKNENDDLLVSRIQSDGSFALSIYSCSTIAYVTAYNVDFSIQSEELVIPDLSIDAVLGNIVACEMVSTVPYLLKVFTGGDTLIGSSASGNKMVSSSTLTWNLFEMDIQNTSQALNEGAAAVVISLTGLDTQECDVTQIQFAIPLKDMNQNNYIGRMQVGNPLIQGTWVQTYNCIDGAEYLHLVGEGLLVDGGGLPITSRDPLMKFEIYFPL